MDIKSLIHSSFAGELAINYLHEVEGFILPRMISDERAVKRYYKKEVGKKLPLENPQTFSEKMNWYKLNGRLPLMVQCADKVGVRDYIISKGYGDNLNPIFDIYEKVEDIDINKLPDQFVLKAAHGTHMQIVVKNKADVNWKQQKKIMRSWLRQDIYWRGREWAYKDVPHRIIAEKYMEDENGELRDYKFFCFHGEPYYMQYDMGRFGSKQYRNYYDINMNFLSISDGVPNYVLGESPLSLDVFEEMKVIARKLSAEFQQVRVDFYCVKGKIIVGEMTFYDGGGSTVFTPDVWNYRFSEKWIINKC